MALDHDENETSKMIPKTYAKLCAAYQPRIIHTDAEYHRAMAAIQPLAIAGEDNLTPDQDAYLTLLTDLVAKYDAAESRLRALMTADRDDQLSMFRLMCSTSRVKDLPKKYAAETPEEQLRRYSPASLENALRHGIYL